MMYFLSKKRKEVSVEETEHLLGRFVEKPREQFQAELEAKIFFELRKTPEAPHKTQPRKYKIFWRIAPLLGVLVILAVSSTDFAQATFHQVVKVGKDMIFGETHTLFHEKAITIQGVPTSLADIIAQQDQPIQDEEKHILYKQIKEIRSFIDDASSYQEIGSIRITRNTENRLYGPIPLGEELPDEHVVDIAIFNKKMKLMVIATFDGDAFEQQWVDIPDGETLGVQKTPLSNKLSNEHVNQRDIGGLSFIFPVESKKITQYYSAHHPAVDMVSENESDQTVRAAEAGVVTTSKCGWNMGYGCYIVIDHGGSVETLYAHLEDPIMSTSVGDVVSKGQQIAHNGGTGRGTGGPFLHFEIRINGNMVDPLQYLK